MRFPRLLGFALASIPAGHLLPGCSPDSDNLVEHQTVLESFNWWDNRDWDWYRERIPFFESPDAEVDATYYYRWELLTKHLVYGSPQTGYTFTEFIDRPHWSGAYGAISCPLGHQAYEIRWLKDRRIIEDFARYWFETPGAEPRSYSNWYGDAMWATYQVLGDTALLRKVLPHMETQVAGWTEERWDPEHRMYRWVGAWDGMEANINSRLTDDETEGGEGYRPTLNSYLWGDMKAIARAAALLGDQEKAAAFQARARELKGRIQEELWDPEREFFFHQSAFDERGGVRAKSLTYETGPLAGDPHGRELLGYVPWQFGLPDPGYESAWKFLMDPAYFGAPFGPTGVERGDPQFWVSPSCCVWSGNAWPYATAQTLTALANLLNEYEQEVVDREDWFALFRTYVMSQRKDGRPYIAEAADPFTGSWEGHNTFYHSEHYFHSGFLDQLITGLVGLRPRSDDTLRVNPLAPREWDYFVLEGVDYHGHELTVLWDRKGTRYGMGEGMILLLDGREVARKNELGEIRVAISPPAPRPPKPRPNNYAVNNDGTHYPFATASSYRPLFPPFYAVDGNRWYHPSPPNRWVAGADSLPWLQVDFGTEREITEVALYFLDDASGPTVEAVGEEEGSGFPLEAALEGLPVLPPERFTLLWWDGEDWERIPRQHASSLPVSGRRATRVAFPELSTSKVRVVLVPRPDATVGLTEMELWGAGPLPVPEADAEVTNLALNREGRGYPAARASYTYPGDSPWEAVDGRVVLPRYSPNRWTPFGTPNALDWLEVDFGEERTVGEVELFLFGDGLGVAAPTAMEVQVWTGSDWRGVQPIGVDPAEPLAWALNRVEFARERTERLRVVFEHRLPSVAGVVELRVFP